MRAPRPSRSVHLDVAGTVFRVVGAGDDALAWIRHRYGPFLSRRPAGMTIALEARAAARGGRLPRPRLTLRNGNFALAMGPCRAEGDLGAGRVRLSAPPAPTMLSPSVLRAICTLLVLRKGGLLLHAAGVVDRGRAWVFCGPSESGKTTIARLAGARPVLNDETIALLKRGSGYTACATPFFGEGGPSMATVNARAPLRALCFLRQAPAFAHRRLTALEAVERAFPQVFLPKRDPEVADRILGSLAELARRVACYELSFAPRPELWEYLDGID